MHATQTNGSESGTEIKPTLHRRQVKQYISCHDQEPIHSRRFNDVRWNNKCVLTELDQRCSCT